MQIGQFIYLVKVSRIKAHSFNFSINPHVSPGTKALSEKLHFQRPYRSTNSYMNIYIYITILSYFRLSASPRPRRSTSWRLSSSARTPASRSTVPATQVRIRQGSDDLQMRSMLMLCLGIWRENLWQKKIEHFLPDKRGMEFRQLYYLHTYM